MRILMTGATGFVGREVARELLRAGHEIVVLTRDPVKARAGFPFPAIFYAWDALSGTFPETAWDQVEGVVHLAGESIADRRWSRKRKRALHDSRVVGTRTLVESMHEYARSFPRVFVSASAIGCYGMKAGACELSEESQLGDDFLARLVVDWEAEANRARAKRHVQVRLGMVLGSGGGALAKLTTIFRAGLGGKLGSGRQWMSWIHVTDAARLIACAVDDEAYSGPVNAVAPEPVTNSVFTRELASALGRPAMFPVPRLVLRLVVGELANFILASQRVIPRKVERLGFDFHFREIHGALAEITGAAKS